MKMISLAAAIFVAVAGSALADPLEGRWRTAQDDNGNSGLIEVVPCGAKLCGTLIKAFGPDGNEIESQNIGRSIIWDTEARGDGEYRGRLYSPDRDKEYNSKLVLTGDRLSVSGCIAIICREGGVWARTN
jgi:uncharacterized protein (DUF2147 family)